jgi:hypothetical protein
VLESGDVVGGGLDAQDEAEFVVDLDRRCAETMLDAGSLDPRCELTADLLGELGSDPVAEEGGDPRQRFVDGIHHRRDRGDRAAIPPREVRVCVRQPRAPRGVRALLYRRVLAHRVGFAHRNSADPAVAAASAQPADPVGHRYRASA